MQQHQLDRVRRDLVGFFVYDIKYQRQQFSRRIMVTPAGAVALGFDREGKYAAYGVYGPSRGDQRILPSIVTVVRVESVVLCAPADPATVRPATIASATRFMVINLTFLLLQIW